MQATALRMLPARQCRLAAAAVQQRQRSVPPRVVRVHASAEVEMDNMGYKAVEELQQLERSGTLDFPSLDSLRSKYNMKRTVDGRVQLRHKDGTWFQLKLDNEVKGTLLLRNSQTGEVHVLQTDKLEQLDLSDDYLILLMFADAGWSETIQPIQIGDGDGNVETLSVTEQQFKDTVGMLRTLEEMEEEDQQLGATGRSRFLDENGGQEIELDSRSVKPLN